jgi:ribosomal-protein-serine acetyltransferase
MHEFQINNQLRLRQIGLSDAREMFDTIERDRDYLRKWLPFVDWTRSVGDSEYFINSLHSRTLNPSDLVFTIRFEGKFAGLIGFKNTDKVNRKSELGYWLSESFQKKGIMTASVKALVDYAFAQLGINRIQIRCATGNMPSKRIPQRLGFTLEGIERDGEILSDGSFTDLEIYSLVKRVDTKNW